MVREQTRSIINWPMSAPGGLGQAELGLSWAPSEQWGVGASVNSLFGTIDKVTTMTTVNTSIATGVMTETNYLHGVLANVGVLYSGFTGGLAPLSIGVNITTPGILHSVRDKKFVYSGGGQAGTSFDTLRLAEGRSLSRSLSASACHGRSVIG